MKTLVKYIGVTDQQGTIHAVTFSSGVNIITGRSSTGKSALIEIFDYCFGNSDFTVPYGVITDCAEFYFVVMQISETWIVLARRQGDVKEAFLREENDESIIDNVESFSEQYFAKRYFLPLADFKKTIRKYFGKNIQITDIDESQTERSYRGNRKKSTPSVRSFTSFMLQHQNLIANKHAIFYRFDEKEKREQVIDHFKVFVGFADQEYFLKMQELENLRLEERRLAVQIPKQDDIKAKKKEQIATLVKEYVAVSGCEIDLGDLDLVVTAPANALDVLRNQRVQVVAISDEHVKLRDTSLRKIAQLTADRRKQQQLARDIQSSIDFAENYRNEAGTAPIPQQVDLHVSQCPFCKTQHTSVETSANDLESAVHWLNTELQKSHFSLDSFREDLCKVQDKLKSLAEQIASEEKIISDLDKQIRELEQYKTQYELAVKVKVKIESVLEELLENPYAEMEKKLEDIKAQIKKIETYFKNNYSISQQMKDAEKKISEYMAQVTPQLDFEESYRPISLHFSLETFDLWHTKSGRKIFLRAMGSGANWLSCHISLFLALNRYFCELGEQCAIPTTLFFDQPSQVYFPAVLDTENEFSAEDIAKKEGSSRTRKVDDDLRAVTQLYAELVRYCSDTLESTGISPQIIVTDHADKLDVTGDGTTDLFEELVAGRRWRKENSGFIRLHTGENKDE